MESEYSIELKSVSKYYSRESMIFEDVTVSFPQNKIIGLVGENGSGKTTFIKMISGMTRHNSGELFVLGKKLQDEQSTVLVRNYISILGDANRALYWNLSGMDNVEYFWTLKTGQDSRHIPEHILGYIQRFHMSAFINNKVETYSKGMKQRLLLLISLLNDPLILFMDEPLNGLDYENAVLLKQMINVYTQDSNGSVFITSHDRNFLNETCDYQYAIVNRKIVQKKEKDSISKKMLFFVKTKTPRSAQILRNRFSGEATAVNEKILKLCIDVNDSDFYQEMARLIVGDEAVVLEASGF